MSRRAEAAAALQRRLGHAFVDPALLERALTHPSARHGSPKIESNQVLEFLGDRVLNLLAAEALIAVGDNWREGDLALRHRTLTSGTTCAAVARALGVGPALRLEGAHSKRGGRDDDRVLGDAMEAILAAIYLDGGLEPARAAFECGWRALIDETVLVAPVDAKTRLNEWAGAKRTGPVAYRTVSRAGSAHAPTFEVEVTAGPYPPASASGGTVRAAEQAAAAAFLAREEGA